MTTAVPAGPSLRDEVETLAKIIFPARGWRTKAAATMGISDRQLGRAIAGATATQRRNISPAPLRLLEENVAVFLATDWIAKNPNRLTPSPDPRALLTSQAKLTRDRRRRILDRTLEIIRDCGYPSRTVV